MMDRIRAWLNTWGVFAGTLIAALVGLIYGTFFKKKPQVVTAGPSDGQKDLEKETQEKERNLEKEIADEVNTTILIRDQTLENLTKEEQKKIDELKDDPKAINEFLLDVGKRQRGEK